MFSFTREVYVMYLRGEMTMIVPLLHIKVEVADVHHVAPPGQFVQLADVHHGDWEAEVGLGVLAEFVREVPGGAETLGLAASEPVVPGQTAGWGRSQHLDGLPRHRLGAGGEILIDLRLELGQDFSVIKIE